MSHDFSAIAVRATMPLVLGELEAVLEPFDVQPHLIRDDAVHALRVNVGEAIGWTMLQIEGRLLPRLAVELSGRIRTEAIGFDVCERHSYEHVSRVELGKPLLVCTMWQGIISELFPPDVRPLLRAGFARTRRRLTADERARFARDEWREDDVHQLLGFFHESIAPIDALGFALEAYENPARSYEFSGAVAALQMGGTPPRFWAQLTGISLV